MRPASDFCSRSNTLSFSVTYLSFDKVADARAHLEPIAFVEALVESLHALVEGAVINLVVGEDGLQKEFEFLSAQHYL